MKAMVTLHYYNYMNMVRLNLVKWLRGLNHRDHQEYKEKCNTSLELIPMICFINPKVAYSRRGKTRQIASDVGARSDFCRRGYATLRLRY
jgi:hypothetical protein